MQKTHPAHLRHSSVSPLLLTEHIIIRCSGKGCWGCCFWCLVHQKLWFVHPVNFFPLFRRWRFWKLHEKSRCGCAFSLTVSLRRAEAVLHGTHLLFFGFITTWLWQNDCVTSPAVLFHQTTKGRRRGPSIRWRQRERFGLMRHPPPTDCGLLLLLSLLQHDWWMTNIHPGSFTQGKASHTHIMHPKRLWVLLIPTWVFSEERKLSRHVTP